MWGFSKVLEATEYLIHLTNLNMRIASFNSFAYSTGMCSLVVDDIETGRQYKINFDLNCPLYNTCFMRLIANRFVKRVDKEENYKSLLFMLCLFFQLSVCLLSYCRKVFFPDLFCCNCLLCRWFDLFKRSSY